MHDQLMAVIARPILLPRLDVGCCLSLLACIRAETVVGMASGLRERLRYLLLCHQIL